MDKPRVFISHSFSDERLFFNREDFNPLRFRGVAQHDRPARHHPQGNVISFAAPTCDRSTDADALPVAISAEKYLSELSPEP
jgi:hypothetical protein